jgi:hypothetical protein
MNITKCLHENHFSRNSISEDWIETDPVIPIPEIIECVCQDCKKCLPLELCVKSKEYDVRYIKHYGLDAYLLHVYGNTNKIIQFMEIDEVYEAQHKFIQMEHFC